MHILLTDVLCCPRCGPAFGMVLLADRMGSRVVGTGRLGCANCREMYPIENGVPRLRGGAPPLPAAVVEPADPGEEAIRLAALLGLAEGGGVVALIGAGAELADHLQRAAPDVTVVRIMDAAGGGRAVQAETLEAGARLPFFDGKLRGVALFGVEMAGLAGEALRVTSRAGRVLVDHGGDPASVSAGGAETIASDDRSLLLRPGVPPGA
jgi:uncharacterized protein YbaR (Trm112 family)